MPRSCCMVTIPVYVAVQVAVACLEAVVGRAVVLMDQVQAAVDKTGFVDRIVQKMVLSVYHPVRTMIDYNVNVCEVKFNWYRAQQQNTHKKKFKTII